MDNRENLFLMYHDVFTECSEESGFLSGCSSTYKMRKNQFEEHVKAVSSYIKDNNLSESNICFTIDDGGISSYSIIAPILEKYNFRGIFFVATKYIGDATFLTKKQIQELDRRGHTIASHSHSHPDNITLLSNNELIEEWSHSRCLLERIVGHEVKIASIPNGDNSQNVINAVIKSGYDRLFTSVPLVKVRENRGIKEFGRFVIHGDCDVKTLMSIITKRKCQIQLLVRYFILNIFHHILGDKYESIKKVIINN